MYIKNFTEDRKWRESKIKEKISSNYSDLRTATPFVRAHTHWVNLLYYLLTSHPHFLWANIKKKGEDFLFPEKKKKRMVFEWIPTRDRCFSFRSRCRLHHEWTFLMCHFLPGHATGVTHPAQLLLVVEAAGLADVELTVQTLTLAVDQELERLQTADAVRVGQARLVAQQLSLGVFSFDLGLKLPEKDKNRNMEEFVMTEDSFLCKCSVLSPVTQRLKTINEQKKKDIKRLK